MIIVAIGANLPGRYASPLAACEQAVLLMRQRGLAVRQVSSWYETAPVPLSDQPWYVNGAAEITTLLTPLEVLAVLQGIEEDMGRVREEANGPRVIDLDLLDYQGVVRQADVEGNLVLPHPRLHQRAFALYPLRDLEAGWQHPVLGQSVGSLIEALPPGQGIRKYAANAC